MADASNSRWFRRRGEPRENSIRVLTAAATRLDLSSKQEAVQQRSLRQGWQSNAWSYRDGIGELRYAVQFLANCTSRMRLFPAAYSTEGETDEPIPLKEIAGVPPEVIAACNQAMIDLGNGRMAIAGLLHSLSTNLTVAGECSLLGKQDDETGMDEWSVRSIDEIVVDNDQWKLREVPTDPNGAIPWQPLDPDKTVVSRIWTPHPRFRLLADSPMRAILDDCESLMILRRMIRATGRSRLAGRGLLLVPDELSIKVPQDDNADPDADPFMGALADAMMAPISDEGVASAVVPIVVRGPGEQLSKVQHIDFASTFDKDSQAVRAELIGVIATGLDIPKEVIIGVADLNHWTAWQVDDNTFRHHVEPHVITCCDSLTDAYFRPYLEALGIDPVWIKRITMWYDPTELVTHPDQTADAMQLHDRMVISDEALRKTSGFEVTDEPSTQELQIRLLHKMTNWPPNLVMEFFHMWDPTLQAPPLTSGQIPGIGPGGVIAPEAVAAPAAPGSAPALPSESVSPPKLPSPTVPGPAASTPPALTADAGGEEDEDPTGVMVAFYLPPALAQQVAVPGGEPVDELHVTLAFLGDARDLTDPDGLQGAVQAWADETNLVDGEISGVGLFTAGPEPVTYLSVDCPALPAARQRLVDSWLEDQPVSELHGFTPHCTLAYANLLDQVQAMGGDPVQFDTVSLVIGSERYDFPLGAQAANLVASGAKSAKLSRKLVQIDRDLRARLQTAANAALRRQLERAGARLRTKVAKDETLRTKIAQKPNERVPAILGEEVVTASGLSADELMGGDWSALQAQFNEWTGAAQTQAIQTALRIGKLSPSDAAAVAAEGAMKAGLDAGWNMLRDALTDIGHSLLYTPDPNGGADWGELNPDTLVPTGTIRAALARAGGQEGPVLSDGMFTAPVGQIGTGATIAELITAGGGELDRYEWVHGPAINPFEPHESLDGLEFAQFDDAELENTGDFPDNGFYFPGDHQGCLCDFNPLWLSPDDSGEPSEA